MKELILYCLAVQLSFSTATILDAIVKVAAAAERSAAANEQAQEAAWTEVSLMRQAVECGCEGPVE